MSKYVSGYISVVLTGIALIGLAQFIMLLMLLHRLNNLEVMVQLGGVQ